MKPGTGDTVIVVGSPWKGYTGVIVGKQDGMYEIQIERYTVTMVKREIEVLRRRGCVYS